MLALLLARRQPVSPSGAARRRHADRGQRGLLRQGPAPRWVGALLEGVGMG